MPMSRGEHRPTSVLTETDVLEIRYRHQVKGEQLRAIWLDYKAKCSKVNVHHIIKGRRWKYLLPLQEAYNHG